MSEAHAGVTESGTRGELQLGLFIDTVVDYAIFLLDTGGHVASWNRGAQRLKGYSAEEIIGRHFSTFYTPEDLARDHPAHELEIALREGRYEEEGWRVRKDGSRFWANVVITTVRGAGGAHLGFGKVTRDLTKRRETEEALRAGRARLEEANAELDRFAVVAAHDLNEPLRTISGFAGLLLGRHGDELSETAAALVGEMGASAQRMQQLIDDLLVFARSGELARPAQPVAVRETAERAIADLGAMVSDRGAAVAIEVPEEAAVMGDPADVEMVVRNLLSNAVKFADEADPRVVVAAERGEDGWRITVHDNGIGIAPGHLDRIFEAFQRLHSTAEYPGTGLGLAICQRIVDRNGGRMGVVSEPGAGSRFWVVLPAA